MPIKSVVRGSNQEDRVGQSVVRLIRRPAACSKRRPQRRRRKLISRCSGGEIIASRIHVEPSKHIPFDSNVSRETLGLTLLSDTESREDLVKDIFRIDLSCQPAQRICCDAQFFCPQFDVKAPIG